MLEYDLGGFHPLHPLRWELTWALAEELGVLAGVERFRPDPVSDELLATVHTPKYIEAVKAASLHGIGDDAREARRWLVHHGVGTDDTPAFPGMHKAAALIAGGSVAGALAIARREVDRAVNIAGGLHHAMADRASGFCVYNDPALAIRAMLDAGVARVAYVDVDVHHGDGVQAAFYDDPRVLTVSIHQSPLTLWPGTGFATETGSGDAVGTSVNIGVPAGSGDADWLRAFTAVVPGVVNAFRPEVLVTQHGADSHADDPLADLRLSVDGQVTSYRALRDLAGTAADGRWLALGGGGYSVVKVVPRAWTHLLATVLDRDIDPATKIPAGWTATAAAARPDVELPTTLSDEMSDGMADRAANGVPFDRWDGHVEGPVDTVIADVRGRIYPLHGLDPFDPRD